MIQPASPSPLPAMLPGCAAPAEAAESAELTPQFAVLLALQLAGAGAAVNDAAPVMEQLAGKAPSNRGGNGVCNIGGSEMALVVAGEPAPADIAPDAGQLPAATASPPPLAVLSIPHLAPPAGTPTAKLDAPATASAMEPPAQPASQTTAKPEQAPSAEPALTRFSLSVGEEAPRRARLELARVPAAESTPFPQPVIAAAEALACPAPVAAVSGTPASAPPRPQAPHDFAALVDRLVEARDTAISARAPQTVSASVTHAEFGNVTMRFETGGDALAVALSNADPEFTRAVQAAAPPTQANMASDNSAQPQGHRQDTAGQQASGSSGHSQQAPSQQRAVRTGIGSAPSQTSAREPQSDRSGIFA